MSECTSLLPPNSTDAERAIECATARIADVPVPIRSVWDPDTCPDHVLPWLAWAFSVDRWDGEWSAQQKRNIIKASVRLHKRKGTPAAVKEVVELILGGGEVVEPWQADDLDPYQFKITTTGLLESADAYDRLIKLVDAAKPVRSWLVAVQVKRSTTLGITLGTFTRTGTTLSIAYEVDLNTEVSPLQFGLGSVTHTGKSVGVGHTIALQPDAAHSYTAAAAHTGTTLQIRPAGVDITLQDSALRFGGAYHVSKTINIHARADEWLISPA